MLFPLLPRRPHRFASDISSAAAGPPKFLLIDPSPLFGWGIGPRVAVPPPRMEATDECAHRACLRMADVTVIHSVVMRATGSISTDIGKAICPSVKLSNGGGILLKSEPEHLKIYGHLGTWGDLTLSYGRQAYYGQIAITITRAWSRVRVLLLSAGGLRSSTARDDLGSYYHRVPSNFSSFGQFAPLFGILNTYSVIGAQGKACDTG